MYLPNTLNPIVCLESFRDHKGTDKAPIQGLENNFMNISKIFLKTLSKFYSLNVLGIDQIGSMLRPYSLVKLVMVPIWVYIVRYPKTSEHILRHLKIAMDIYVYPSGS